MEEEHFIDDDKCLLVNGTKSKLCDTCERKAGTRSISNCPFGVSESVSKDYSVDDLLALLSKDFTLMQSSGGGVTFSGGEPLLQIGALEALFARLVDNGISIAVETTLMIDHRALHKALLYADVIIVDLKLQPEHPLYNNQTYIQWLEERINMCRNKNKLPIFRLVVTKKMTEELKNTIAILKHLGVCSIELLKCHNLGQNKYNKLGIDLKSFTPSDSSFVSFVSGMNSQGINTVALSV